MVHILSDSVQNHSNNNDDQRSAYQILPEIIILHILNVLVKSYSQILELQVLLK
jgi:hypothetical protein